MAKSYQLVAWTDQGQVRMIPSQMDAFVQEEMGQINRIIDRVRYGTYHEVGDLLKVSSAYEKQALRLLDLGQAVSYPFYSTHVKFRRCFAPVVRIEELVITQFAGNPV